MAALEVDPVRFELIREGVRRGYTNFAGEQPHSHAAYDMMVAMEQGVWTYQERIRALDALTPPMVQAHGSRLLGSLDIECLCHGNLTRSETLALAEGTERTLRARVHSEPSSPALRHRHRCVDLGGEAGRAEYRHCRELPVHSQSAVEVFYQVGLDAPSVNARLNLFCQIVSELCFNRLHGGAARVHCVSGRGSTTACAACASPSVDLRPVLCRRAHRGVCGERGRAF